MRGDPEVVIAGAGLVGAALGLGLSRLGIPSIICERGPLRVDTAPDARGLALNLGSVRLLEHLGVWSRIAPRACAVKEILVTQRGHFGSLRLSHRDLDAPVLGYVCPADRLQQAMLEALADAPGVSVRASTSLESSTLEEARLTLALRDGQGQRTRVDAALLVGADGTDSTVRREAGIAVERRAWDQVALVCNIDVAKPDPHTAFERFTTEGPVALLPLAAHRHVLVRCASTAVAPALAVLDDADYLADAQARFGHRLGAFSNPGPRRAWPLESLRAVALHAPRRLLMGNAATTVHPNAAQGLNLGLRDVVVALELFEQAKAAGQDPGAETVLARYAARRRPDHLAIARTTDFLASCFAQAGWPFGVLRQSALLAADRIPPLKRRLLRRLALGHAGVP